MRRLLIRAGLLVVVTALVIVAVVFGRRVGLGEWALIAGFFAVVIAIESVLYIGRQFLDGLRGDR